MSVPYPEPDAETDPRAVLARRLAWARASVVAKVGSLTAEQQRTSLVPSGWTALELASHVAHMERRWFVWGFLGEQVEEPWGDTDENDCWRIDESTDLAGLTADLDAVAARTGHILATTPLEALAATGGRFQSDPPSLATIGLHVLTEYARHLGHLDVAVELAGGPLGE